MASFTEPIKVEGLREFQKAIKQMDSDLAKMLRLALNDVVNIVVDDARPKVPRRSGKAASSVKAQSTQNKARIAAGGSRAPYFPWLDFGGKRKGRGGGVAQRPFKRVGRYIWHSFGAKRPEVIEAMTAAMVTVARQAGLEVTQSGGSD